MENHRKLTFVGAFLLILTFLLNNYHQETHPESELNYAYVTGIAMLGAFAASLLLFTKDKLKTSDM